MYPPTMDYYLTIETRNCEIYPREVLLALAAASQRDTDAQEKIESDGWVSDLAHRQETIESDNWVSDIAHGIEISEFFPRAFVWAGNLHIKLPDEYETFVYNRDGARYRRFEDFLNVVMKTYPCVTRAVFVHLNDTAMSGNMIVYCMKNGRLTQVEKLYYGDGYDDDRTNKNKGRAFSTGKAGWGGSTMGEESVDYIQAKYGLHTIDPWVHSSYRADLVDVEVLV